VHRVLLADGSLDLPDQLFGYLERDTAWGTHPDLQPLIDRAIVAVRGFEASRRVTYGPIYGDGLQLRINPHDGRVGVIDWGTVSYGPLLFDLALVAHSARSAGHDDLTQLWSSYLEVAPLDPSELDGLAMYTALMWARSAKYFAYRLEHRVELGDPSPTPTPEPWPGLPLHWSNCCRDNDLTCYASRGQPNSGAVARQIGS
jgi:Phosphotransferase enzyme family